VAILKFGSNYSKELIEVLKESVTFCDYIKIGAFGKTNAFLEEAFSYKPLLIHGFGWYERGGMPSLDCMNFQLMKEHLLRYHSPFLGMHALAYASDIASLTQEETLLNRMIRNFIEIKLALNVPLLIENLDFSPFYTYETTTIETVKPDFLTALICETNTYLLLDLSHAKVSAYQLGMDIFDYMEQLPLERTKEIHFSGSFYSKDEGYKDIHGIMSEEDYEVATYLAQHPKIRESKQLEVVTLEYGSIEQASKKALIEQMNRLKTIFSDR
jgi:uncharacterized protein